MSNELTFLKIVAETEDLGENIGLSMDVLYSNGLVNVMGDDVDEVLDLAHEIINKIGDKLKTKSEEGVEQ